MAKSERDIASQAFSVTNWTEDLTFDANTATLGVTSDVLGTLINELIKQGIISGTVSS